MLQLFDDFCWYSSSHRVCRHITSHHAVGTYDGSVANGHSRHHAYIVAQPDIVAYHHRAFAVERTLGERQTHVLTSALPVAVVCDEHISGRKQVVADSDAVDGSDMGILTNSTTITYNYGRLIVVTIMRVPCCLLHMRCDRCATTYGNIFETS